MKKDGVNSNHKQKDSSIMSITLKLLPDLVNVIFKSFFTDNCQRLRPKTQSKDLLRSSIG